MVKTPLCYLKDMHSLTTFYINLFIGGFLVVYGIYGIKRKYIAAGRTKFNRITGKTAVIVGAALVILGLMALLLALFSLPHA